jgi:hypothetical protein
LPCCTDLEESRRRSKDDCVDEVGGDQQCRATDKTKESLCGDELKSGHQRQKAGKTQEELVRGEQELDTIRGSHRTTRSCEEKDVLPSAGGNEGNPTLTSTVWARLEWNGRTDRRQQDLKVTWVYNSDHGAADTTNPREDSEEPSWDQAIHCGHQEPQVTPTTSNPTSGSHTRAPPRDTPTSNLFE